jgi:hypothetical protein
VTDGTKQIGEGGTGATTAAGARTNLSVNSIDEDAQANALKVTAPALYFDGAASVVTVANDSKLNFTDGTDDLPFSMSAWAYVPDPAQIVYLVGKWGTSSSTQEWLFATNTSGQIRVSIGDGTSSFVVASTDTISSAGWYHFAVSYSGSGPNSTNSFDNAVDGFKLFINGVESSVSGTTTGYNGQAITAQTVRLGAASNLFSKGSIRDCKIFNRELTADEVAELARGNDLGFSEEWGGANGGLDTSNFASGTDGYSASQGTVTGNEDSIGGENDWLKLTLNTSTAIHQILSPQVMPVGARVRVEFDCYIPSTNSHVDGVKANLSSTITSSIIATHEGASTDTVFRVSGEGIATGNQRVYITALDGSSTTVSDSGGDDWIAIKNVKITQLGTLADFRAEDYNESASKLLDRSSNNFVGVGTSVTLTGNQRHISADTIDLKNLPTSSAGLSAGEVWSNGGVLTVV